MTQKHFSVFLTIGSFVLCSLFPILQPAMAGQLPTSTHHTTPASYLVAQDYPLEDEYNQHFDADAGNYVQIQGQGLRGSSRSSAQESSSDDMISLGNEMAIGDLIQLISELTGETFLIDESVKTKRVTIVSPREGFKSRNAIRIFEAVLDLNGFSIVSKDGVNKIVNKRDIKSQGLPTEIGGALTEPSSSYVTRVLQLKNVSALDVANTLKPFVSREGDIVAYPSSNTIIIVERRSNLNRLLRIIDNIDLETSIDFVKVVNVDAGEIAAKITEIFSGGSAVSVPVAGGEGERRERSRRTARRSGRGQAGGQEGQQSYLGFKIITDERSNTLIIAAHPDDLGKIKEIITKLDVIVDQPEQGIYVIPLQNADAEQVVSVLSSLISGGRGTSRTTTGRTRRASTGTTARGSTRQSGSGLATSGLSGGSVIQREISGGLGLGGIIAEADGLRITAAPATNSVIIISSRKDYDIIKGVIDKLDIRRRQVFVEAAILEVGLDNLRSLGANLSIGFTFNDDNLGFGFSQVPGVPSLLGITADEDVASALIGNLSGLVLGVVGEEVDPDGSGPIPPIPSFSAIFTALASKTDVNVLSTPSLLTTDNEQAEIVVADVIPFPTGTTVGDSGVTVQTIDREPVGIRLSITPQISEGDYLNLNIHTEVSAVRETAVPGLNTEAFGIATTTRTADSSVVVKNGQTIVIGGLVQDRESIVENKVPLLGDIPFIGNLFKFKQSRFSKINLMILLTPRIVENESDMQAILEETQRRNMLLQDKHPR